MTEQKRLMKYVEISNDNDSIVMQTKIETERRQIVHIVGNSQPPLLSIGRRCQSKKDEKE